MRRQQQRVRLLRQNRLGQVELLDHRALILGGLYVDADLVLARLGLRTGRDVLPKLVDKRLGHIGEMQLLLGRRHGAELLLDSRRLDLVHLGRWIGRAAVLGESGGSEHQGGKPGNN